MVYGLKGSETGSGKATIGKTPAAPTTAAVSALDADQCRLAAHSGPSPPPIATGVGLGRAPMGRGEGVEQRLPETSLVFSVWAGGGEHMPPLLPVAGGAANTRPSPRASRERRGGDMGRGPQTYGGAWRNGALGTARYACVGGALSWGGAATHALARGLECGPSHTGPGGKGPAGPQISSIGCIGEGRMILSGAWCGGRRNYLLEQGLRLGDEPGKQGHVVTCFAVRGGAQGPRAVPVVGGRANTRPRAGASPGRLFDQPWRRGGESSIGLQPDSSLGGRRRLALLAVGGSLREGRWWIER